MSIIHTAEHEEKEIILCTLSWISKPFHTIKKNKIQEDSSSQVLEAIFDIRTPFLMDGEANKLSVKLSSTSADDDFIWNDNSKRVLHNFFEDKVKKARSESPLSTLELMTLESIKRRFERIREDPQFKKYFTYVPTTQDFQLNNASSRKARELFLSEPTEPVFNIEGKNDSDSCVVREVKGQEYLIPPVSRFIAGDVYDLQTLLKGEVFDVVVLDPPWQNRHVRRKRKERGSSHGYRTLSVSEVMRIALPSVLSDDAFVFLWITNSPKVNEELLASLHLWHLELLTTWFWIKTTRVGEPVTRLDSRLSRGKAPYEKLLVTRRKGKSGRPPLPKHLHQLLLISIPSSVHSHKPPLNEVLREVLKVDESWRCLELFARYLTPGWTSLGNDVLRFQNLNLLQTYK